MNADRLTAIEAKLTRLLFPHGGWEETRELIEAVKEANRLLAADHARDYQWLPCQLSVSGWSDNAGKDTWERTLGHFHGGTTWEALVHMEPDNYAELRQAMEEGAFCDFTMYPESREESIKAAKPDGSVER